MAVKSDKEPGEPAAEVQPSPKKGKKKPPKAEEPAPTEKSAEPAPAAESLAAESLDGWKPRPIVSNKTAWGLATLSLVLCPISFAGFDVWPLAFIAWVPLIIALRGQAPKRAALLGWYAGFGMTMIGFYWLIDMLKVFSGFPLPLCILFGAILCAQKGGRIALMGWLYARGTQRGWPHALTFLGAFAVSELIYPVLFPWYFGAAMHNTPILMQTADLGGPILVSVVVLAVNVAVAELAEKPLFSLPVDRRTLIGGAAALVVALGYGAWRMSAVQAAMDATPTFKVGLVQGNSPLMGKGRVKSRADATTVHIEHTKELREKGAELVVWSEGAVKRSYDAAKYEQLIRNDVSRHLKVPTVIGAVLFERMAEKNPKGRQARFFNTALMADEKGNITSRYDKQFLLMFGEYLPFGETFPVLYEWSPNSGAFSPGTSFKPLVHGDHRLSVMICYEDIIPGFAAKLVSAGDPDLLINMSIDTWFGETIEPWQHLALAKFRSVEHRRYLVRATNTGVTAIVDPTGRTTVFGGTFTEEAHIGEARYMRMATLFSAVGEKPWWGISLLVVAAAFFKRRRPPGAPS